MSWLGKLETWLFGKKKPAPVPVPVPTPAPTSTPVPVPVPVPTFVDTFSGLSLSSDWIVSDWGAPQGGTFVPANVELQGMLCLKLQQTIAANGEVTSVGGEIQLNKLFGYGTYEWTARASSTSPTPTGTGMAQSGSVTGLFNYINNSQTEIDIEIEGQYPNQVDFTNWETTADKYSDTTLMSVPNAWGFHDYKFVWAPGVITYYIDNVLITVHNVNVPVAPAYPMINHWGTNSASWGGVATEGERYLYVSKFSFTAA